MDKHGHSRISDILENVRISANIDPIPEDHETFPFVTITTSETIRPERVLNALGKAGLIDRADKPSDETEILLRITGVQRGSLTFEDIYAD